MRTTTHTQQAKTVLLFGPQTLSSQDQSLSQLRTTIRDDEDNDWMREVIRDLPRYVELYSKKLNHLQSSSHTAILRNFVNWLDTEDSPKSLGKLPNTVLTPLVVLGQLAQYAQYVKVKHVDAGLGVDRWTPQAEPSETIGFCTGILSALAVSCSYNKDDFKSFGAVAVRLGTLIGVMVDADDQQHGNHTSLSTAWTNPEQYDRLRDIVGEYASQAYISVHYDKCRATLTASSAISSALQKRLREHGIVATEIGLRGRFHSGSYQRHFDDLVALCDNNPELQFSEASELATPTFSTINGELITSGKLHDIALREILVESCKWHQSFENMVSTSLEHKKSLLVIFGQERCVPPTLSREVNEKTIYMMHQEDAIEKLLRQSETDKAYSDDDIAVVGMAAKVAGADDLDELWDLMCRAESQHCEVPESRFTFDTHWREVDPKRKWFGNFIRDHDTFDHKFFKKSPREVSSQDPQQRLFLQSAYHAVEQSGYFNLPNPDPRVGVFVGVCAADYEANIACYQPNAFSATGNLKSFIAGKISHYFGWTGPGLTIDTACSASAVAVHQACRAILGGECTAAIAGGTNVMTSPLWFQNLAGATFLSQTGACKPFDAKADGYCRGEAVASVFLKKMSQAIKDGDTILGCIRSTAVYQNENCTPIFVPNAPSLSSLFEDVIQRARLQPQDINLVEAHGTGTPVGDPAEWESIKKVVGGRSVRSNPIPIGSIKGLIGHTECVSGVVALIKVLLELYRGMVPPQASFQTLSPGIKATSDDMLEVNTKLIPWTSEYRTALINNYGASGSNASMIVAEAKRTQGGSPESIHLAGSKQGFWLAAYDERSLREYCSSVRKLITARGNDLSLSDLSYQFSRQSNRSLQQGLIFRADTLSDFDNKLKDFSGGKWNGSIVTRKSARPIILCFGGQIAQFVGLDQTLYDSHGLLREHLNYCDSTLLAMGLNGIYPTIFEKTPILDTIKLQTTLFAMQYACAKCWIDCGARPVAVVGHSFGELTALCVAGVLSLKDSLRVVAARAQLIKDLWGSDSGVMMAIEGDLATVTKLLQNSADACSAEPPAAIACYNGPRSFTVAGSTKAMAAVEEAVQSMTELRSKKLSVANAFHSSLVGPLEADLARISNGISFKKPSLHWERATEAYTTSDITPAFFAMHMRQPVYANHAFQRLHKKFPAAVWLEAGSNSTITNMASKALGAPSSSFFQGFNLCIASGQQNLLDGTINLWKEGINVNHWTHHASQTSLYELVLLPPYQFEKSRHWLELKKPQKPSEQLQPQQPAQEQQLPVGLFTFIGYQDDAKRHARFRINTMVKEYEELVSGHVIAQTAPICPATVEIDMTIEALRTLRPDFEAAKLQPEIHNVVNQAPVCIDPARAVWLDVHSTSDDFRVWSWEMTSNTTNSATSTLHVSGQIVFRSQDDPKLQGEFARYERLLGHQRCLELLNCNDPDDTILGRNMYKVFAEIVDYAPPYHGLQKLVGKGNTSAGHVLKQHSGKTWLDAHLSDCFSQVGGFWVNCMTDRSPADMYIAAGFESWLRAPPLVKDAPENGGTSSWNVMASHHKVSDKAYTTDIFIFNASTGALCEVILGINYARIPKSIMIKTLVRLTASGAPSDTVAMPSSAVAFEMPPVNKTVPPEPVGAPSTDVMETQATQASAGVSRKDSSQGVSPGAAILAKVAETLAELTGLDLDIMKLDTKLADIGIDSLMGMEMVNELADTFKTDFDMDRLAEATLIRHVTDCVASALGVEAPSSDSDESADGTSAEEDNASSRHDDADSMTSISDNGEGHDKDLQLPSSAVLEAFGEAKLATDQFITDYNCAGYMDNINPKQTQLCIALILEAFEQLGCSIRTAHAGDVLRRIPHAPQHGRLVQYLYEVLEEDARLININESIITRTAVSAPTKSSKEIVDNLVAAYPNHNFANRLAYFCGTKLVDVLSAKLDGVKLIFGDNEGRELVSGLYGDSLLNKLSYKQMEDILKRLVARLPPNSGPLKILEMGAGTGGTTKYLVPLLAELNVPVEYTFTDLAPSFVAAARKKYKEYPFMKFRAHDIEAVPADDLIGTQHLIVASNAVHATHSLPVSVGNIRKALRPDGFLMMLEMTETLRWVDIIFGLLEGWWLFDDGRPHALSHQSRWETELHNAGYGHVDWTDGHLPENRIQRIIIAMASGPQHDRLPPRSKIDPPPEVNDISSRKSAVEKYIEKYTANFLGPQESGKLEAPSSQCVVVTGATGSLGCHLVAHLAAQPTVTKVICLNRVNRRSSPNTRQKQALEDRGITIEREHLEKLQVIEADTSKPHLGLSDLEYTNAVNNVTHIIHNAWPMSGNRAVDKFEAQFQVMRNLIDLCTDINTKSRIATFQLISSIAVVGHQPLWSGNPLVPEEQVDIESVLPNGYGDAKYVCERMLAATLQKHPEQFRSMSVRLGQVAGSSHTGYWNTQEHLSFLVKSSQTLRALPDFDNVLSWTPVDKVAGTLTDLVFRTDQPDPIYHIDNPVRQPWKHMIKVWADALDIPLTNIIPFEEWVRRVRHFPGSVEKDNPAFKLVDFLDGNFIRMSCGGLLLDTKRSTAHSETLASVGPVSDDIARGYIRYWKQSGFLSA